MEEAEWVTAVLAGDKAIFANLVDKFKVPVFNLALRMLGDREEAAEHAECKSPSCAPTANSPVMMDSGHSTRGSSPSPRTGAFICYGAGD
jgi:hypothetical protein